jgi:hypothetical protein
VVARADHWGGVVIPSEEPTAQAQANMERLFALVKDCRRVLPTLERPREPGESSSAEAERILYYTLMSAIDAGLIKTMEDALRALRHASQPLGPMGAEWLERQEQKLKSEDG